MKVTTDVYTKDLDAALAAVRAAMEVNAVDVNLRSSEDWDTKEFEYFIFSCEVEHDSSTLFDLLDAGPFSKDYDSL